MSIGALTSAFATLSKPATGVIGAQQERADSAPASSQAAQSDAGGKGTATRVVFNPRSHYNASAGVFVMEYRSPKSGEIERQFPDEQQLRAYENARKLETARERGDTPAKDVSAQGGSGNAARDGGAAVPPSAQAGSPSSVSIRV